MIGDSAFLIPAREQVSDQRAEVLGLGEPQPLKPQFKLGRDGANVGGERFGEAPFGLWAVGVGRGRRLPQPR